MTTSENSHAVLPSARKRVDYISWDDFFIGVARLAAQRSKDPETQNGATIVNQRNRIIGVGYNGMPDGLSDDEFPWGRNGEHDCQTKYPYVIHAEKNAILNSSGDLHGCRMYVWSSRGYHCCGPCAAVVIQSGIKEVIFANLRDEVSEAYKKGSMFAAKRMFEAAGIKTRILHVL